MKKVLSLFLIISLILSVSGAVSVYAEKNYITNGDFENNFTGWSQNKAANAAGEITIAEENGNKYAKIVSTASPAVYIKTGSNAAVQPGDWVTIAFDIRIVSLTEGASARIAIDYRDKNNSTIESKPYYDFYENRGEWVRQEINLLIPDNASGGLRFDMRVRGGNGGEVHFDNVAVTKSDKDATTLRVGYGDLKLDRIPDGVNSFKAKLHYVSESGAAESGNLILAAYSAGELAALEITPYTTDDSVYKEVTLTLAENAKKDISVKAYVWKNGQTLTPIAKSVLLPEEGRSSVFDRLITEKMRGAYGSSAYFYQDDEGDGKYEVMEKLLEAGINTFIFQIHTDANGTGVDKNFTAMNNAMKDLSEFAEKNNVMVFPKFNFGTNAVVAMADYGLYNKGNGTELTNVCPLAEAYWKDAMQARMEIAAQYPNITGVIFDMEMYAEGGSSRYLDPCFCNNCTNKFAQAQPSDEAAGLAQAEISTRMEYAKVNNLYTIYRDWQAGEVTKIGASIREHLHKINPNLIIGAMPGYGWMRGLNAGLGTKEMPVLCFGEGSYDGDFRSTFMSLASIERNNDNAVFTLGLYPRENGEEIAATDFANKIAEAGTVGMGYWIYSIQYLEGDFTLQAGETLGDYYPELKKGNEQLDAALGRD